MLRTALAFLVMTSGLLSGIANAGPCAGFADVDDTNAFCTNVAWMKQRQITLGCAQNLYCPTDVVTRLSMAAFLNRLGDVVLPPNVIWVAKTGGMFQSIQAAIDYAVVNDLRPTLIKVAPGVFTESIHMDWKIDVEGSGIGSTIIQSETCTAQQPNAVVRGIMGAQLRNVTIAHLGAPEVQPCAVVDLIYAYGRPLRDVEVRVLQQSSAGNPAYGIHLRNFPGGYGETILENVAVSVFGSGTTIAGIFGDGNNSPGDPFVFRNVQASVSVNTAAAAIQFTNAVARLDRVSLVIETTGPPGGARSAVLTTGDNGSVTIQNSTIRAPGGQAVTNVATSATLRIANSLLEGGLPASITCFANYDPNFVAVNC